MMKYASITRALEIFALACVAIAVVSGCALAATTGESSSPASVSRPMYMARTTLMEFSAPRQLGEKDRQKRLANLCAIATSQKVLSNAAASLNKLGVKYSVEEIRSHTKTSVIRDTNIIAMEVTLPDAAEAKMVADVLAAELKKVYTELNVRLLKANRISLESQLKTAKQEMARTSAAFKQYEKKGKAAKKTELTKRKMEYDLAQTNYSMLRMELDSARIAERQVRNNGALKTVDPAYVSPAK